MQACTAPIQAATDPRPSVLHRSSANYMSPPAALLAVRILKVVLLQAAPSGERVIKHVASGALVEWMSGHAAHLAGPRAPEMLCCMCRMAA